jgi:hypothetical protein
MIFFIDLYFHSVSRKVWSPRESYLQENATLYVLTDAFINSFLFQKYEGVSKSTQTCRLERKLHIVELSATKCSCFAISWVSLVSFTSITLCVASQQVIPKVSVFFVIDSVRKRLDTPYYYYYYYYYYSMVQDIWKADYYSASQKISRFLTEPEGSSPCSQKPATAHYPEPAESSSPHRSLSPHLNVILPPTPRSFQWSLAFLVYKTWIQGLSLKTNHFGSCCAPKTTWSKHQ